MGYADDPYGTAELIGTVSPGQTLTREHNPDFDQDLRFYLVSRGVDGARDVSRLRDAVSVLLPIQRTPETPVIGQSANASTVTEGGDVFALVPVGATGFSRHARFMKVEVAEDADFSVNLETTIYDSADFANQVMPYYVTVRRPADTAQARHVRVSYSGGSNYGPVSNTLEVTFPAADGSGGSSGSFDPNPRLELEINLP